LFIQTNESGIQASRCNKVHADDNDEVSVTKYERAAAFDEFVGLIIPLLSSKNTSFMRETLNSVGILQTLFIFYPLITEFTPFVSCNSFPFEFFCHHTTSKSGRVACKSRTQSAGQSVIC
jgi:hypothetical protein